MPMPHNSEIDSVYMALCLLPEAKVLRAGTSNCLVDEAYQLGRWVCTLDTNISLKLTM